jgi:hypothetical protein
MYVCTQGRCGCFFLQFFSSLFFSCLLFLLMRLMGAVKHVLLVVARGITKRIGRDASWGLAGLVFAEIPLLGSEFLR